MNIQDLQGKLVAVLGYGVEGKAVTTYLMKHGITPVLFDQKPWQDWAEVDQNAIKSLGINFIFGPEYLKELKGFDVAFRSPGVRLVDIPKNNQLIITSQTKWFFEHCPAKIVGVTGTKGKGTTCSLIHEVLSAAKIKNYLTGNIGQQQPFEILDQLTSDDIVVYELSSFQLQDLTQSPHIGVVLMVTEEHLDYHADQKEYVSAKEAIVKYQTSADYAVINQDYPNSLKIGQFGAGQKYFFSRKTELEQGCFVQDENLIIKNIKGKKFQLPIANFQLKGAHNWENISAAVMVSLLAGADEESIKTEVSKFKGLEHRLEFVAEKNGIKFYNDSFSTTPETAIAAINSFTEPLIVILGGSSKNSNFSELGKTVMEHKNIKAIILIGQEAGRIKQTIGNIEFKILEGAQSMADIFEQIQSLSKPGEVVLLSPACASFGMFKNYKDRGEQFKQAVMDL